MTVGPVTANGWRVVDEVDELDALRSSWNELARPTGSPTTQHTWASACAHAFHAHGGLNVVVVVRDGQLVAVAPLGVDPATGGLEPLGRPHLARGADFVAADEGALDALAEAVAEQSRPVNVPPMEAGSPVLSALAGAYVDRGLLSYRPAGGPVRIELLDGDALPVGSPALERLDIELSQPGPIDVHRRIDRALAAYPAGWRERPRQRFARRFATATAALGLLRLGVARLGGRTVALQLAVEHAGRLWLIDPGAGTSGGSPWSPGAALVLELVRDAAHRGLRSCELLDVGGTGLFPWASPGPPLVAARGYPRSML